MTGGLSGIGFVNWNGLRWCDAQKYYGSHKTPYHRCKRWGEKGVFLQMMAGLAAASAHPETVMINATYLKAHRTVSCLRITKGCGRLSGRTKGGMNTKLHADGGGARLASIAAIDRGVMDWRAVQPARPSSPCG